MVGPATLSLITYV